MTTQEPRVPKGTRRSLLVSLLLLSVAAPVSAARRELLPVPQWQKFDGTSWSGLAFGQTTRAQIAKKYACATTEYAAVMRAKGQKDQGTTPYLIFEATGPEARLASVLVIYESERDAPKLPDWKTQFGADAREGYLVDRGIDWRFHVASGRGVAALIERDEESERIRALLFAPPTRLEALSPRLRSEPTANTSAMGSADVSPRAARFGSVIVNLAVDPSLEESARRLQQNLAKTAEGSAGKWPTLQAGDDKGGLVVTVTIQEQRRKRSSFGLSPRLAFGASVSSSRTRVKSSSGYQATRKRRSSAVSSGLGFAVSRRRTEAPCIRVTATAVLNAETPYGPMRAASGSKVLKLDAGANNEQIENDASGLVSKVVEEVAGAVSDRMQAKRSSGMEKVSARAWSDVFKLLAPETP